MDSANGFRVFEFCVTAIFSATAFLVAVKVSVKQLRSLARQQVQAKPQLSKHRSSRTLLLFAAASASVFAPLVSFAEEVPHPQDISRSASARVVRATKEEPATVIPVLRQNTEVQLITKERAAHLAEQHLALQGISWGKPVKSADDQNFFLFGYETPKTELRLIGQRTVTVSKRTGLTKVKDRR